jgi:hypothetical protein
MRAASFVLLGAAAVGLVAGGYFGIRTLAAKSDRDAQCGPRGCTWEGKTFDGEARSLAERSTAWFVFGTIAAGGGIGLLWISRTYANNPTTARIGLDVGPRGACAVLEDAW